MLDSNLNPWLLEINGNPSFHMNYKLNKSFRKVVSPVDLFIKEKVIEGAIDLVMMNRKE